MKYMQHGRNMQGRKEWGQPEALGGGNSRNSSSRSRGAFGRCCHGLRLLLLRLGAAEKRVDHGVNQRRRGHAAPHRLSLHNRASRDTHITCLNTNHLIRCVIGHTNHRLGLCNGSCCAVFPPALSQLHLFFRQSAFPRFAKQPRSGAQGHAHKQQRHAQSNACTTFETPGRPPTACR